MPPASVASHISQAANVLPHLPLGVIFNGHVRQLGRDLRYGSRWNIANFCSGVYGEFGEDARRVLRTECPEALERCLPSIVSL